MSSYVLVTGAAGFIGARFVESCALSGMPLISVDAPLYFRDRKEHKDVEFGIIVDREKLFEWLERERPPLRAIVHLGACTDTTEFDIDYLTKMNLAYSQRVWEYCSTWKIPLIYASSAATYGDGELGYRDDENTMGKLRPLNPYGESKLVFDLWAMDQEKKGVCPPSWSGFKFFNVYGFGERHKENMSSVIVKAFDQIRATGKARLFKSHRPDIRDGEQRRDFVFVEDVVNVLRFAMERPISRGIYNLGTGQARTFLDLTRAVFKAMNVPEKIEYFDMPVEIRPKYQYFTEADMSKLRQVGYTEPFTSLEEGVRKYVQKLLSAS